MIVQLVYAVDASKKATVLPAAASRKMLTIITTMEAAVQMNNDPINAFA